MHHHIRRTVSAAALAAASATALAAPSQADPSDGDGWQTTVCDNGSTYSFAVRAPGNTDKAQFFQHFAFHDSATNEDGTKMLLPVMVITAAYSRFMVGRMIPTRHTEDLVLAMWDLIQELARYPAG